MSMAVSSPTFQIVGQKRLIRNLHIWKTLDAERWKCVLCGGVTKTPSDSNPPEKFEPLSEEEREMGRNPKRVRC